MLGVWEYRQELCIAMNDMNINIYDDSLREEELLKFGNNVAKIINGLQDEVVLSTDSPSQELLTSELRNFSES